MEEIYKVIRIDEPDFGCEGRLDGQIPMDLVQLRNEQGETKEIQISDSKLYELNVNEGDRIYVNEKNEIRKY